MRCVQDKPRKPEHGTYEAYGTYETNETNETNAADVWRRAMVAQRFGRTVIDRIAKQHALCFFFEGRGGFSSKKTTN